MPLTPKQHFQFKEKKNCILKKVDIIAKQYGIKAAVFIQDVRDENNSFIYQSTPDYPHGATVVSHCNRTGDLAFIHLIY
jgi:hypothetical protein